MFLIDQLILAGGIVIFLGILLSKFSARLGLPVLVLFLALGMLAGQEGIGGIAFDDFGVAHAVGTLALAVIMFDGGMRTEREALAAAWKPAVVLATFGVLVTALITGLAAAWILHVPILVGVLLGSIVGSTDAAAVFGVLRSQGLRLRSRVSSVLEIESGSNDPMAIFMTVGIIQVLVGQRPLGPGLLLFFVQQMGIGAAVGLAIGGVGTRVINRVNLGTAALYPVLAGACGLLAFGVAAWLGGSGFLSIYLAGIVLGNSRLTFQRGTLLFLDGLAWLSQIVMFVVFGLLSMPSQIAGVLRPGLEIAAILMFVARPLSVIPVLPAFRFSAKENVLVSWVGLRGAVPIILATFPLMYGVPQAPLIFDIVFFVVLLSAVLQGWSLPVIAGRLGLREKTGVLPPVTLDISSLRQVDADIVDYTVGDGSVASGRRVRDLGLPEDVVIAMITRGEQLVLPRGSTGLERGDHVFVVLRPESRRRVDEVFASRST